MRNQVVVLLDILEDIEPNVSVEKLNEYLDMKYSNMYELSLLLVKFIQEMNQGKRDIIRSISFFKHDNVIYYTVDSNVYRIRQWLLEEMYYFERIK